MKTTTDCHCQPEIPRDGSGQHRRYLNALDPGYAPVDERSLEDLLVFAKRYAAQIRFWPIPDPPNPTPVPAELPTADAKEPENWREFFRRDWAVVAASVAVVDLVQIKKDYDENRSRLEAAPSAGLFRTLFDPILGIARRLDRWYTVAMPGNPLHDDLTLLINSSLRAQIGLVMAYDETFRPINANKGLNLDYTDFENPERWGIGDEVPPVTSIYEGEDLVDKLRNAALFVDDVFQAFYNALRRLVDDSDKYVRFALEQYPAHQPYMALFIAFLELFRLAQAQLNTLTQRHLEFYYRDVLRLGEQPARPDRVHVVFELAQEVSAYFMPKGTPLAAGRDAAGKDLIYRLSADFVASQTQVNELKTIRLSKEANLIKRLYARPNAKSKDGFGLPFDDAYGKWDAFGKADNDLNTLKNPCDIVRAAAEERFDQTSIGFAIASPQLLLQGGNRKIELKIDGLKATVKHPEKLEVWLTGEKEWVQVARQLTKEGDIKDLEERLKSTGVFAFPGDQMRDEIIQKSGFYFLTDDTLHIYLPLSATPVVAYDPKKHGGLPESVVQPVLKILVNDIDSTETEFSHPISTASFALRTKVGSVPVADPAGGNANAGQLTELDGLKKLVLQNDAGLIDGSAAFDPFTAYPDNFSSFYIGSDEVFNKPPNPVTLQVERGGVNAVPVPADALGGKGTTDFLYNRSWKPLDAFMKTARRTPILPVTVYDNSTPKGFLRVTLAGMDLPREANLNQNFFLLRQQIARLLRMKTVAVCYDSTLNVLEVGIDQFLHIYPFGVADVTDKLGQVPLLPQFVYPDAAKLLAQSLDGLESRKQEVGFSFGGNPGFLNRASSMRLPAPNAYLPALLTSGIQAAYHLNQYTAPAVMSKTSPGGIVQEEGNLYIGLDKLKPLQTLSLLFQIAEGTAEDEDYTDDPPQIHWSYLVTDEMRPLPPERIISDGTYGLQTTGIIKFDIPADITTVNTLLTNGLSWLCASVTEHADRVPKLIDVRAQAMEAVFDDQQNDPAHYQNVLPAKSIGNLVTKPAEVKGVDQPFASFDGKPRETGGYFYSRVSERLRHKARAINTWDYEHLLLDEFPHTYKVKCIPHTDPNCLCRHPVATETGCCGPQVAPGHVLIVPISDFKNRNAVNPLQPKTSYRVLRSMERFLAKRTSPFVTVHARNPRYEEVIVTCKVRFYDGVDTGFYLKKLNDEIVRYLTPWAFEETADVSFDQKIYASAVINFIDERPYVDFITDFKMGVCQEQCCPPETAVVTDGNVAEVPENFLGNALKGIQNCDDLEQLLEGENPWQVTIAPSTSRSLVVSVPQHLLLLYEEEKELTPCEKLAKQ